MKPPAPPASPAPVEGAAPHPAADTGDEQRWTDATIADGRWWPVPRSMAHPLLDSHSHHSPTTIMINKESARKEIDGGAGYQRLWASRGTRTTRRYVGVCTLPSLPRRHFRPSTLVSSHRPAPRARAIPREKPRASKRCLDLVPGMAHLSYAQHLCARLAKNV